MSATKGGLGTGQRGGDESRVQVIGTSPSPTNFRPHHHDGVLHLPSMVPADEDPKEATVRWLAGSRLERTRTAHATPAARIEATLGETQRMSWVTPARRREELYDLTVNSPAFSISNDFIACLVCQMPSIGFNVQKHVNGNGHQKKLQKLCRYTDVFAGGIATPRALTLAEAISAAETLEEAKKQRLQERKHERKRSRDE